MMLPLCYSNVGLNFAWKAAWMPRALSPGSVRRAGGRPKGSKNKRTLEFMQKVEARGISPLELMVMHELWAQGDKLAAFACAEKIAPYTRC
jgi:hypothetical protein